MLGILLEVGDTQKTKTKILALVELTFQVREIDDK